jgi:zinc transport system permease protein
MVESLFHTLGRLLAYLPFECMSLQFMQRAVLALLLLAPMCAIMGVLVVNFRMAFFSDAISHSAFTGVAAGILLGVNPWGAVVVLGILMGVVTIQIKRKAELAMDTTLGVLFSSMVALGLAVISHQKGLGKRLPDFLYGDILAISPQDLAATALLLVITGLFLWCCFNRLLFISLHEDLARSTGIHSQALETLFAAVLALVIAFSIRAVGILLVTAMLVIPAAAAVNFSRSIRSQVVGALIITYVAAFGGLAFSVNFDITTGAAIILCAASIFSISLGFRTWIK